VRRRELLELLKSTAYAWFETYRPLIEAADPGLDVSEVDTHYNTILQSTAKSASRNTYLNAIRSATNSLIALRQATLSASAPKSMNEHDDLAPDFSALADDTEMREILVRRWLECCKCVKADAHLAAIVMMGGLLEALLMACADRLPNKARLLGASSAPKDRSSGKTLNYQEWSLDSYIKVARELGWITESARGVAEGLRDYRNYVHPGKEHRHGIILGLNDSSMFWEVVKALARQLLLSASQARGEADTSRDRSGDVKR
jgi:hypothetical protein